ncbi:class I SAM-dependent methyltransferase [Puniceicoccaceae bacterium K14]|nr:class I SAM-dependent methyltransferase [Puniceicoccaceae bacterium K14]
MHCIDQYEQTDSCLKLDGWYFKYGTKVAKVVYRDSDKKMQLDGFGRESGDLAVIYGEEFDRSRFIFEIEGGSRSGLIEFYLEDGTSEGIRLDGNEGNEFIEPLRHQIRLGKYLGLFELAGVSSLSGVSISLGDRLDEEAEPIESFHTEKRGDVLRVEICLDVQEQWTSDNVCLHFNLEDGTWKTLGNIALESKNRDRAHVAVREFIDWVNTQEDGLTILEIGSRARSGVIRRSQFKSGHRYIGIDALEGDNVDLVCDAHTMSENIEANSVDVVISYAVFEHLAMPWKVALEMNKVMKLGGRCMILAPHAWPLHETPFDFWRYSEDTWRTLFNRSTGFKVLEAKSGEPAIIEPEIQMEFYSAFKSAPAHLCSVVVAEKVCETELNWNVPVEDVYEGGVYPA